MTKSSYFIFLLLVVTALFFFVRLAIETVRQEKGATEQRETDTIEYVEREME